MSKAITSSCTPPFIVYAAHVCRVSSLTDDARLWLLSLLVSATLSADDGVRPCISIFKALFFSMDVRGRGGDAARATAASMVLLDLEDSDEILERPFVGLPRGPSCEGESRPGGVRSRENDLLRRGWAGFDRVSICSYTAE